MGSNFSQVSHNSKHTPLYSARPLSAHRSNKHDRSALAPRAASRPATPPAEMVRLVRLCMFTSHVMHTGACLAHRPRSYHVGVIRIYTERTDRCNDDAAMQEAIRDASGQVSHAMEKISDRIKETAAHTQVCACLCIDPVGVACLPAVWCN